PTVWAQRGSVQLLGVLRISKKKKRRSRETAGEGGSVQPKDLNLLQAHPHLPSARREATCHRLCRGELEDHQWLTGELGRRGADPAMVADALKPGRSASGRSRSTELGGPSPATSPSCLY